LVVAQVLQNATHFAFFKRKLAESKPGLIQLAKTEVSEQLYWTYFDRALVGCLVTCGANLCFRLAKCGRFAFLSGSWLNQARRDSACEN
jgi:hypothetical protein